MILEDAHERDESRELDQENESGGSATRSPSLRQVLILGLATLPLGHSDQLQELH